MKRHILLNRKRVGIGTTAHWFINPNAETIRPFAVFVVHPGVRFTKNITRTFYSNPAVENSNSCVISRRRPPQRLLDERSTMKNPKAKNWSGLLVAVQLVCPRFDCLLSQKLFNVMCINKLGVYCHAL